MPSHQAQTWVIKSSLQPTQVLRSIQTSLLWNKNKLKIATKVPKLVENTISDPEGGDVVTETVTILRESVDSVTRESSIGGNAGVETKLISTSTISQQVTESDGSVTATATIDSAIFEEVTNMGKKIIDETLEKVQVHMAKVVELERTDLTSAEDLKAIGQVMQVL